MRPASSNGRELPAFRPCVGQSHTGADSADCVAGLQSALSAQADRLSALLGAERSQVQFLSSRLRQSAQKLQTKQLLALVIDLR